MIHPLDSQPAWVRSRDRDRDRDRVRLVEFRVDANPNPNPNPDLVESRLDAVLVVCGRVAPAEVELLGHAFKPLCEEWQAERMSHTWGRRCRLRGVAWQAKGVA